MLDHEVHPVAETRVFVHPDHCRQTIGQRDRAREIAIPEIAPVRVEPQEHEGVRDDFPERLVEMLAFFNKGFPEQHPFNRILVQPEMPGGPEVWLLGSSSWSADAASQLGLPYAFAHFINPEPTRKAIEFYRKNFKPSQYLSEPKVLLAAGCVAADTEEEADRLYTSYRMRRIMRDRGDRGPIPSPEESEQQLKQ